MRIDFNNFSPDFFNQKALEVFAFQYENNKVYREFCQYLNKTPQQVKSLTSIPFLPIEFFKTHNIYTTSTVPSLCFTSSGTTSEQVSRHFVAEEKIYRESFRKGFEYFFGDIKNYTVLALLPSYLERSGSSLIYMVADMIKESGSPHSGFYLYNHAELVEKLNELDALGEKIILIGVSFALLDLVKKYKFSLKNTIIMETGGMKGRGREMIREELHAVLKKGFGVSQIYSEYGMTELLSQGYLTQGELFRVVPWMKILIRDPEDPFSLMPYGRNGGINVIDLANVYSCSFIATQDLGRVYEDGSFEVLGRFDSSDIRGCNLLVV